jgi:hypothetical protein
MKSHQNHAMDRFMLHLTNKNFAPPDATILLRKARDLCKEHEATIRDSRVSSRYLEFDVSVDKKHLESLVSALSILGPLDHAKHIVEEDIEKEKAIDDGIFYFNNERFWECHEVLEGVWKKTFEGEKELLQGIILVAAAFVHYQKDENDICLSIFDRALQKLANSSGPYHKIDIDRFRKKVQTMRDTGKISTFSI